MASLRGLRAVGLAMVACLSAGCGGARYVLRSTDAGVVAIPHNSSMWPTYHRKKAEDLMASHFPQGYEIVREEEVVVGSVTRADRSHSTSAPNENEKLSWVFGSEQETVSTENRTEYRITYRPRGVSVSAELSQMASPTANAEKLDPNVVTAGGKIPVAKPASGGPAKTE